MTKRFQNRSIVDYWPLVLSLTAAMVSGGCANEVLKGQVETARKNESTLAAQLEASQKNQAMLNGVNAELLAKEAAFAKERLRAEETIARLSEKMEETRRQYETQFQNLTAENDRLRGENREAMERIVAQNASMSKKTTEVIIPNNGRNASRPLLSDPAILPPRREGDDLVVELQDHLIFSPEDDKLSEEGKARLRTVAAEILRAYPDPLFRIEGNYPPLSEETATRGAGPTEGQIVNRHGEKTEPSAGSVIGPAEGSNQVDLSSASIIKAKTVADYLIADCGVPINRVILAGASGAKPLVSDATSEGRKRNRRVEWVILGGG